MEAAFIAAVMLMWTRNCWPSSFLPWEKKWS